MLKENQEQTEPLASLVVQATREKTALLEVKVLQEMMVLRECKEPRAISVHQGMMASRVTQVRIIGILGYLMII